MKNKVWEFAISLKQVAIIGACLVCAGVFLSGAGVVTGLLLAPRRNAIQARMAAPQSAALELPKVKPSDTAMSTPQENAPVQPAEKEPAAAPPVAGTGLESVVLATSPAPASAPPAPSINAAPSIKMLRKPGALPVQMAVQVGSFSIEKNALEIVERLKGFGYPAAVFPSTDARSRHWHVVQVGPYAAYDEASRAAMELSGKYRLDPRVVPLTTF